MLWPIFFVTCFFDIEKINGAPFGAPFIIFLVFWGALDLLDFLEPLDFLDSLDPLSLLSLLSLLRFKPAISSLPLI